jgi:two-component system, NarL family, sensor kinase
MISEFSIYGLILLLIVALSYIIYQHVRIRRLSVLSKELTPKADTVPYSMVSEIVEQERTRISTELHDELGTLLSVIHLDLELVMHEASSLTPYGESRLMEVRKNLNLVIGSIRNNIWNLSSQMFDQVDLTFAIRELCKKLDAHKGTRISFVQSGVALPISEKQKLNLFRIVQELMTNIIKHSSAWNIAVHVHWDKEAVSITLEDDGTAFNRKATVTHDGHGIVNITKRASFLGAKISKEDLTKGQRVVVELKFENPTPVPTLQPETKST